MKCPVLAVHIFLSLGLSVLVTVPPRTGTLPAQLDMLNFHVALLRTSYRLALAAHVCVWLLWGWAIWREWDMAPVLWLAYGVSMLAVFILRNRLGDAGERSETDVR